MTTLAGKTALVTLASHGIGRDGALALARAGAQVLVHHGGGDPARAEAVIAEIREAGGRARRIAVDLRTPDGPHRLAERTRTIIGGRLDVCVVSTGAAQAARIEDTTVEAFDGLFALNVRAAFFLVQQLLPVMCRGSSVLLAAPPADGMALDTLAAWTAGVGAVETLARHLAATLGARGIRINALTPAVLPARTPDAAAAPGRRAAGDPAEPGRVGAVIAWLASDEASDINGDVLRIGIAAGA